MAPLNRSHNNQLLVLFKSFFLFTLAFYLVSCEKKYNSENNLALEKTFRFFALSEIPTLDWSRSTDASSSMIISNVMDGLVEYDFSGSHVFYKPALAKSITSKNNGQKWIIELKKNVRWSDGVVLTSQHVIDGWERVLNPKTAAEYAYFLFYVKNAREYNSGKIKDFSKVGIRIIEDGKLEIELTGPRYFFPFTLTHSITYPIRKDVIKKFGPRWTGADNIVTLGPYRLDKWKQGKVIILKKNPTYYGSFPGNVENISIRIIPELSTVINLFDGGKLDYVNTLPSKQLSALKNRPEYSTHYRLITNYYGFQTKKAPLDNIKVRKAIAMAVDKTEIEKMTHGNSSSFHGWIPKKTFAYNKNIGLSFNPKKARKLLSEVDAPESLPKITITHNTLEDHKRIAENIQAQLKKNLGLNVEVKNEEWKTYLKTLQEKEMMIYRLGWVADYPDPDTFMGLMLSYSEQNHTSWKNKKYDQLVEQAAALPNNDQRRALYDEAQKILTEQDVAVLPLSFSNNAVLLSKRIKYYPQNIMAKHIFKEIKIH